MMDAELTASAIALLKLNGILIDVLKTTIVDQRRRIEYLQAQLAQCLPDEPDEANDIIEHLGPTETEAK